MDSAQQITISNIPEISAIYFALLQCGYDYYSIERSKEHNDRIRGFTDAGAVPHFFSGIKQNTCEVYPYWPRAAILETASFYLQPDHSQFQEYNAFRDRILSAGNIADNERDQRLWDWMADFPAALSEVLASDAFQRYFKWENKWIAEQNTQHEAELRLIGSCLDVCVSKYGSPVQNIQIVINPIKCVYSADYYLDGNCFLFSSGAFQVDSVIHEFLHHVVHPAVVGIADMILANKRAYPGIDDSYYLSGDDAGQLNAFEEYAVRELTKDVMRGNYPDIFVSFLRKLISENWRRNMYIETPRMIIRDFSPEDAGDLYAIFGDDETMENCEPAYDLEKTEKFLTSFCIGQNGAVAAVHKESGKVMGYILFNEFDEGVYEMGWIYNRNYWRQGYAYESCKAVINYAFTELKAHKIFAEAIDTVKSVSLMKKLGMQLEGIQRSQTKDNHGNWADLHFYGLLEEDWGKIIMELPLGGIRTAILEECK